VELLSAFPYFATIAVVTGSPVSRTAKAVVAGPLAAAVGVGVAAYGIVQLA